MSATNSIQLTERHVHCPFLIPILLQTKQSFHDPDECHDQSHSDDVID
ncbi:hypothetical protein [Salmonella enterica]